MSIGCMGSLTSSVHVFKRVLNKYIRASRLDVGLHCCLHLCSGYTAPWTDLLDLITASCKLLSTFESPCGYNVQGKVCKGRQNLWHRTLFAVSCLFNAMPKQVSVTVLYNIIRPIPKAKATFYAGPSVAEKRFWAISISPL